MKYDILEQDKELWDLFTRKEEYNPNRLDKHNKFIYDYASHKDIMDPKASKFLFDKGFEIDYPDGKSWAICLTHDIDDIYPPIAHSVLSSLHCIKNLNLMGVKYHLFWKINGKQNSPYRNLRNIIEIEENYNAKSSFYFITASRDVKRFRYHIEDLEEDLGFIRDKGWEVGLHGGYYSYADLRNIKKEKSALERLLGKKVIGYRNHYLRFEVPITWELLAKAGFKYDTTLGYDHMVGFRNGMCHPFTPYNLGTNRFIDIWEIPLCVMDVTLPDLNSDINKSFELVKSLMHVTEKYHGVLTLLWHNNMFNCPFRESIFKLYNKILKLGCEKNAWITSGEDILNTYQ